MNHVIIEKGLKLYVDKAARNNLKSIFVKMTKIVEY